jgi:Tol biopolymer transport system component
LNPRTGAADGVLRRLSARPIIDVSLSPDGREAALLSEGQDSLWVVSELPGNERLVSAGFLSVPMRWSPDGKSIYLASLSLSGAAVVRVGASGGPAEAVVSGAIGPGLTVDGRHVVQMEPSTGAFSAIVNVHSLAEGAVRSLLVSLPYTPVAYSWSPRGMNLVMALSAPGGTMLVAVDLDGASSGRPFRP